MTNPIEAEGPAQMPVSQPVLLKALRWGVIITLALIVVFAGIGWLVSGSEGLIGGVIGTAMGGLFLGLTVGSIAFANRFVESPSYIVMFFAIVMGSWILKFVIFIVLLIVLRDQPWLDGYVLFFGLLASVLAALAIDVVVITRSRMPVIQLPE
ncbi:MAG: 3-oxoacyl-ACP reductase [Leucobacter sp.]